MINADNSSTHSAPATVAQHWPAPIYVGRVPYTPAAAELVFAYLTALQMQAKIAGLTGYKHPAFTQFAAILGRFDPATGTRTSDRPTPLSIILVQRIARDLAKVVVRRETFLDADERLVFIGVDLSAMPTLTTLRAFLGALYGSWLGEDLAGSAETALLQVFAQAAAGSAQAEAASANAANAANGYEAVLAVLLQHGGLYYA